MTVRAQISMIALTANAKNQGHVQGVNLASLMTQFDEHAAEMQNLLKQIIALHPVGGGDAANLTALNAILTSLS